MSAAKTATKPAWKPARRPAANDASGDLPFWRTKRMSEMTAREWESLCDGCGRQLKVRVRHSD